MQDVASDREVCHGPGLDPPAPRSSSFTRVAPSPALPHTSPMYGQWSSVAFLSRCIVRSQADALVANELTDPTAQPHSALSGHVAEEEEGQVTDDGDGEQADPIFAMPMPRVYDAAAIAVAAAVKISKWRLGCPAGRRLPARWARRRSWLSKIVGKGGGLPGRTARRMKWRRMRVGARLPCQRPWRMMWLRIPPHRR